jgi:hypothetical protein
MQRPAKSALEALLELLDPTAVVEAARALEAILARQAERAEQKRRAA